MDVNGGRTSLSFCKVPLFLQVGKTERNRKEKRKRKRTKKIRSGKKER